MVGSKENFESEEKIFERIKHEEQREREKREGPQKEAEKPRDNQHIVKEKIVDLKNVLSKKVNKITDLYNMWQHTSKLLQTARAALGIGGKGQTNLQRELEDEFRQADNIKEQLKVLIKFQGIITAQMDEFLDHLIVQMLDEVKKEWAEKLNIWYGELGLGKVQVHNDGSLFYVVWGQVIDKNKAKLGADLEAGATGIQMIEKYYDWFRQGIEKEAEQLAVKRYNAEIGEGLVDRLTEQMQKVLEKQAQQHATLGV